MVLSAVKYHILELNTLRGGGCSISSVLYNASVLNHDMTAARTCSPPPIFGRKDGSLPYLHPVSLAIARGEFTAALREEVKNTIQVSSVQFSDLGCCVESSATAIVIPLRRRRHCSTLLLY